MAAYTRTSGSRIMTLLCATAAILVSPPLHATEPTGTPSNAMQHLRNAYPDHIADISESAIVWKDGSQTPLDAPNGDPTQKANASAPILDRATVRDMLSLSYDKGKDPKSTPPTTDPGRARPAAFFTKMYGDCRRGETKPNITSIAWLPGHGNKRIRVTRINGVDKKLRAVSHELAKLPKSYLKYLVPAAGGYNCRVIAGTKRLSPHSYGIAIDIAVKHTDYWRWNKPEADGSRPYKNRIPLKIVAIFEKHGFIWGGRWKHYDTMHFEYRPELLPSVIENKTSK